MKLKEYAARRGWGPAETAHNLDIPLSSINRIWYRGDVPKRSRVEQIYVATHGQVRPDDFYDLPSLKAA